MKYNDKILLVGIDFFEIYVEKFSRVCYNVRIAKISGEFYGKPIYYIS